MYLEYCVISKRYTDISSIESDLSSSAGDSFIPNRQVQVVDSRPTSNRMSTWLLTKEEAKNLKKDSRVLDVTMPARLLEDLMDDPLDVVQKGNFTSRPVPNRSNEKFFNSGLPRANSSTVDYNTKEYEYTLDGTGVDVVIMDSGIAPDSDEWLDKNGNSRLQKIDWYAAAGVAGTLPDNFYSDEESGHGTHVASTAAGRTCGWAKEAHIYSFKVMGTGGITDYSTAFDLVRLWHERKNDINSGVYTGRPTIVNMSFSFKSTSLYHGYDNILRGNWRGKKWQINNQILQNSYWDNKMDSDWLANRLNLNVYHGLDSQKSSLNPRRPMTIPEYDAGIEEMIDAGIHIACSAGNDGYVLDEEPAEYHFADNTDSSLFVYEGDTKLVYDGVGTSNGTWKIDSVTPTNIVPETTVAGTSSDAIISNNGQISSSAYYSKVTYNISGKTSQGQSFTTSKVQDIYHTRAVDEGLERGHVDPTKNSPEFYINPGSNVFKYDSAGENPSLEDALFTGISNQTVTIVLNNPPTVNTKYRITVGDQTPVETTASTFNYSAPSNYEEEKIKITVDLLIDRGTTGTIYPPALAINEEEPDLLATCYTHFYFVKQGTSSILPTMSKENISISIPQKGSNFNNYVEIDYIPSDLINEFMDLRRERYQYSDQYSRQIERVNYARKASPYHKDMIVVGNAGKSTTNGKYSVFAKNSGPYGASSSRGPGVSLYAPGEDIVALATDHMQFNGTQACYTFQSHDNFVGRKNLVKNASFKHPWIAQDTALAMPRERNFYGPYKPWGGTHGHADPLGGNRALLFNRDSVNNDQGFCGWYGAIASPLENPSNVHDLGSTTLTVSAYIKNGPDTTKAGPAKVAMGITRAAPGHHALSYGGRKLDWAADYKLPDSIAFFDVLDGNTTTATANTYQEPTNITFTDAGNGWKRISFEADISNIPVNRVVHLSPQTAIVPANSLGQQGYYDEAKTSFHILDNSSDVTHQWTITTSSSSGVTYEGVNTNKVRVTNLQGNSGTITFTAVKPGETSVSRTFSISKVLGADENTLGTGYVLKESLLNNGEKYLPEFAVNALYPDAGTGYRFNNHIVELCIIDGDGIRPAHYPADFPTTSPAPTVLERYPDPSSLSFPADGLQVIDNSPFIRILQKQAGIWTEVIEKQPWPAPNGTESTPFKDWFVIVDYLSYIKGRMLLAVTSQQSDDREIRVQIYQGCTVVDAQPYGSYTGGTLITEQDIVTCDFQPLHMYVLSGRDNDVGLSMNLMPEDGVDRARDFYLACPQVEVGTTLTSYEDVSGSNYFSTLTGTSMASPQVCGLGALHLQENPTLTPQELKDRLVEDCVDLVSSGGSYGNGKKSVSNTGPFIQNRYASNTSLNITGSIELDGLNLED